MAAAYQHVQIGEDLWRSQLLECLKEYCLGRAISMSMDIQSDKFCHRGQEPAFSQFGRASVVLEGNQDTFQMLQKRFGVFST